MTLGCFDRYVLSRRTFLRASSIGLVGAATGLLAACGPAAPAAAPTGAPTPAAAAPTVAQVGPVSAASPVASPSALAVAASSGGTVQYGSAQEPSKINTITSALVVDYEIAQMVYSFLVKVDDQLQFVPDLATQVPTVENGGVSADGKTYTFKLQPGVKWHDGQPLTADDVKFTHELVMNPNTQSRTLAGYSSVDRIDTPDPQTVVFNLKDPFPAFVETWAYTNILPRHVWSGQDPNTTQLNRQPVGSGAFTIQSWAAGQQIVLQKNPAYFKAGLPRVNEIVYKIVPDANTLLAQVQTGEVRLRFKYPTTQVPVIQNLPGLTFMKTPALNDWRIWLNNRKPIFQDKAVRQALSYGIDRQGIINNVYKGLLTPAYTYISPRVWAYDPNAPKYPFDQDKAKSLLDQAGWSVGPDGIRAKEGTPLSFEIMNVAGEQERVQVLQLIQARWKEIGVDMSIKPTDVATLFGSAVPQTSFDAYYSFWLTGVDPSDRNALYLSDSKANTTGYGNPSMDKVLTEAASTTEQAKRKQLYAQAQQIEGEDQPILHLFWIEQFDTTQGVANIKPNPTTQTNFWNAEEWTVAA